MDKILQISIVLVLLDLVWIYFFMAEPFKKMILKIQGKPMVFDIKGAIIAYTGLIYLAVKFLPKTQSPLEAFLLGSAIYSVYDATNYATLINYSTNVMVFDILWGGTLFLLLKYIIF